KLPSAIATISGQRSQSRKVMKGFNASARDSDSAESAFAPYMGQNANNAKPITRSEAVAKGRAAGEPRSSGYPIVRSALNVPAYDSLTLPSVASRSAGTYSGCLRPTILRARQGRIPPARAACATQRKWRQGKAG